MNRGSSRGRIAALALVLIAAVGLNSSCSTVGYLWQSSTGHLAVMSAAQPVADWLARDDTPEPLKDRLRLSQRIRDYASQTLHLPDNASYRRYADLRRSAVIWNVVATPELSLTLKTWCFPITGCIGYRGYYDESQAQALASTLREQGMEVSVYGVPAYSTLGWFSDPLLNTFIEYPEGELARMIFHELAHQVVYVKDDTTFNESFATAVERLGAQLWLAEQASPQAREAFERSDARRQDFRALTTRARARLSAAYATDTPEATRRQAKIEVFDTLRAEYETLKTERWQGFTGYDGWVQTANNAALAVMGAYNDGVAPFERLFVQEGQDFARFYAAVKRLAALPKPQRDAALAALPESPAPAHQAPP